MNLTGRRAHQRGSALLIVLVMAAMIAIMLYREIPVAMFEARRRQEQLLIDRGNEYRHAIKLYVRRFQSYPPTIDALEDTNRMRFLRKRYADPFTGKTDWRLLHAGPGGMIIDSKIKQSNVLTPDQLPSMQVMNAGSYTGGGGGAFPVAPAAASSGSTSTTSSDTTPEPSLASMGITQRPPAISANGSSVAPANDDPLMASAMAPSNPAPDPTPASSSSPDSQMSPTSSAASAPNGPPRGGGNSMLPPSDAPLMSASSNFGGGGIAGVASISAGPTIKSVNDQRDRSLWEFVFDMRKEAVAAMQAAMAASASNIAGTSTIGMGSPQTQPSSSNSN